MITLISTIVVLSVPIQAKAPIIAITRDNMAIKQSVRIKPGSYTVADADGNGVLRVQADNVVIDFQGAKLAGSKSAEQDTYEGIGIDINGRKNVVVKNATVSGYKFNIRANGTSKLRIEACDLGRSRAQRISRAGQPVDVWLVLRDVNAWRGYGAGLWLERSTGAHITKVKSTGAQNGIVLIDSNRNTVHNNDVSFNSGWGIALWGSSENNVSWNLADWVNRPWAGGWGGDSAGIVVVNSSNKNAIIGNSITHGGDGFFLTDRVNGGFDEGTKKFNIQGASNDNIVAHNDGSWSPNNAFEGTFSSGNLYVRNIANDSRYGFWLGFSTRTVVFENEIANNSVDGVAIEQGSYNMIRANTFSDNKEAAVHLWGGTAPHLQSVPSRNNAVSWNKITNSKLAMSLEGSAETHFTRNELVNAPMPAGVENARRGPFESLRLDATDGFTKLKAILPTKPKDFRMYRERNYPKGAQWLRAGSFAPHDFRGDPVAWRQLNDYSVALYRLHDAEPEYTFQMPEWLKLTKAEPGAREYLAEAIEPSDAEGTIEPAGLVVSRGKQSQRIDPALVAAAWDVRWFKWDKDKLGVDDARGWDALFSGAPLARTKQRLIAGDFSFRAPAPGVPHQYFAFEATTSLKLPAGRYRISALPDDGLRVYLGDDQVISAWRATPGNLSVEAEVTAGVHPLRIRFMQTWGHSYLNFSIRRV